MCLLTQISWFSCFHCVTVLAVTFGNGQAVLKKPLKALEWHKVVTNNVSAQIWVTWTGQLSGPAMLSDFLMLFSSWEAWQSKDGNINPYFSLYLTIRCIHTRDIILCCHIHFIGNRLNQLGYQTLFKGKTTSILSLIVGYDETAANCSIQLLCRRHTSRPKGCCQSPKVVLKDEFVAPCLLDSRNLDL